MKQNTVVQILIGAALVPAIVCLYLLLAPHGQSMHSPSAWLLFGSIAFALPLVTFLPIILRSRSGLPAPKPLSPSDIRFVIALILVLCPLTFWACLSGGAYGSLVILLVPIAFMFRFGIRGLPNSINKIK